MDLQTFHPPPHLLWCHKDVDNVVVEILEGLPDVLLEEVLDFPGDDRVLVVGHVGVVGGVVVLRQGPQLVLTNTSTTRAKK